MTENARQLFNSLRELIRRSEHNHNGVVTCLICGEVTTSKYVDAGNIDHAIDCPVDAARGVLEKGIE